MKAKPKTAAPVGNTKFSVQPVIPVSQKDNGWSQFEAWAGQTYFPEDKVLPQKPPHAIKTKNHKYKETK